MEVYSRITSTTLDTTLCKQLTQAAAHNTIYVSTDIYTKGPLTKNAGRLVL